MTGVKDIASKNFFLRNLINFYNFHKNFKEYSESKIYKFVLKYKRKNIFDSFHSFKSKSHINKSK